MATSAFKSATKRTPIGSNSNTGDCGSSNRAHRLSRSLSQFSRRPESAPDFGEDPVSKGIIVNAARGSAFPEISLDDLAIEFFPTKVYLDETHERSSDRGRLSRRSSEIGPLNSTKAPSQRRGRSVSRHNYHSGDGNGRLRNAGGGAVPDTNSRRRRSVSVARCQASDCKQSYVGDSQSSSRHANTKSFNSRNSEMSLTQTLQPLDHRQLERFVSHKDLSKSHSDYSSHSSTLTDDEAADAHCGEDGIEKIIRAVYARKKAEHPIENDENSRLYKAVRKELGYAVEEIRTELEQAMIGRTFAPDSRDPLNSGNNGALRAVSAIKRSYATKLEKSEKRKQDLLAEMELEEQRGKELLEKVRELLPDSKKSAVGQKPSLASKRSDEKNRMSKRLTEEAGKYLEDFVSNVEGTDVSSFDGEKSDASSTFRGTTRPRVASTQPLETESSVSCNYLPIEMNGVNFPWLKWDNANDDGSPPLSKTKAQLPSTPVSLRWDAAQVDGSFTEDRSNESTSSSRGSWSPGLVDSDSVSNIEERGSKAFKQMSSFDMEEYVMLERNEEFLFLSWTERHIINSGGLLLCNNYLF